MGMSINVGGGSHAGSLPDFLSAVKDWLPSGGSLPQSDWMRRHRHIVRLLIVQSLGLILFGTVRGYGVLHSLVESLLPMLCAGIASVAAMSRASRAVIATFGLIASSGIFVHLSGGTIEAHFHFFIMLAVISLYQEWRAFLLAIVFVALHHGTFGVLDADAVYNHPAAVAHPWRWAFIHATLVLGESVALIAAWRFGEEAQKRAAESGRQLIKEEQGRLRDQAKAQRALQRRESQLEQAQKIAKMGSWECDPVTNTVETSEGLHQILGVRPHTFRSMVEAFMSLVHPHDQELLKDRLDQPLASFQPYDIEFRGVNPAGDVLHMSASGRTVTDEDGNDVSLVGTVQDITDHKTLEAQLMQSQKMEAIGQLAGGVAHDFNNLLSVVVNYGKFVIKRLSKDDPAHRDVEEIIRAGNRGAKLTRQLLTFSRKGVVKPEILDLNQLVMGIRHLLSRAIQESIHLSTDLSSDLWLIEIDSGEAEQVIINLAMNAKDAMPTGGELLIETGNVRMKEHEAGFDRELAPGDYIHMKISDSGSGMTEDVKARIFDPFFTTKGVGRGTGLGLAVVYGIIKRANGFVTVDSEVGAGSTFNIYLPRASKGAAAGASDLAAPDVRGNGEVVLVVEEEDAVRELMARLLCNRGYSVLQARGGREALLLIDRHGASIDLVLIDVIMPDSLGLEVARRMGDKTLYVSGYPTELVAQQGIPSAGEALLQKPFTEEELLEAVQVALERAHRTAGTPSGSMARQEQAG